MAMEHVPGATAFTCYPESEEFERLLVPEADRHDAFYDAYYLSFGVAEVDRVVDTPEPGESAPREQPSASQPQLAFAFACPAKAPRRTFSG